MNILQWGVGGDQGEILPGLLGLLGLLREYLNDQGETQFLPGLLGVFSSLCLINNTKSRFTLNSIGLGHTKFTEETKETKEISSVSLVKFFGGDGGQILSPWSPP